MMTTRPPQPVEIPENQLLTATVTLAWSELPTFLERAREQRNYVEIAIRRSGANAQVTVHVAIMDLSLQLAAAQQSVERLANEIKGPPHMVCETID